MIPQRNEFEELGLKVQRAQLTVQQARGVGVANGVEVVVDAENRLLSVTVAHEATIIEAYNAALADLRPKVDEAMREVRADARVTAMSTFIEANSARLEAQSAQTRAAAEDDEPFYAERHPRDWLRG